MTFPFPPDPLIIAGKSFASRLILGTGKYPDFAAMKSALEVSGTEMVTVATRRIDFSKRDESLLTALDLKRYMLLPNTAGCYSAEDAVRYARLGREAGFSEWIKLEVIGDERTLFPDTAATIEAARVLVKEGFIVLAYTSDDLVVAKRLVDAGVSAVMPLAAPIGSGMGIQNRANLMILREQLGSQVPLIVDAGVGTASEAAAAMELGFDGVLMNTGVAHAREPVRMAEAMKLGVIAGRHAFLAGRMAKKLYAQASSPVAGMLE